MNGFVKFITFGKAIGITLSPFGIYIQLEWLNNKRIINHESIHWKQQMEMLIIPFYIWYVIEWFIKLFCTNNAYTSISFEREAYGKENDFEYLKNRKPYSWFKYIKN